MAKFIYRMQNILEIKYKLETQAKSVYAEANAKLNREELKLKQIYDDINKYQNEIRQQENKVLNVSDLKWCCNAIEIKKKAAIEQQKAISNAKRELELARIKLKEVMIERKTHEKLKEKAFDEFKKDLQATEKKEIDELVSFKFNNIK